MPKSARRRTDNVLTMPSAESPTAMTIASGVTEDDIARRARIPPCPQCDATNAERVVAAAPESHLRWFRCRGCEHLWSIAPPASYLQ
jgi:hypothetical protein